MRGILVAHARTSHGDALSELNPEPERRHSEIRVGLTEIGSKLPLQQFRYIRIAIRNLQAQGVHRRQAVIEIEQR